MIHFSPTAINEIGRLKSQQHQIPYFACESNLEVVLICFNDLAFDATVQPQDQV
ncbi:MAG: hypothetical protein PT118_14300 [Aphanizomenon gracile PMC644.10]|nr:hypothetical protein [Aphanizomenon gracile PMC644.10]